MVSDILDQPICHYQNPFLPQVLQAAREMAQKAFKER